MIKRKKIRVKRSIMSKLFIVLYIVFFCGIVYSLYNIFIWKDNVDANSKIKNDLSNSIKIIDASKNKLIDEYNQYIANQDKEYVVDFEKLKEKNPDTVAYLKVNNTNIDYVVVKGKDNEYYLDHNFNKKYNVAGWIFGHYLNKFDGTDKNLVIFGHNTLDNSMFGSLKKTLTKDWQSNKENLIITLVTEQGTNLYEVFSTYKIEVEDYYITTNFYSDDSFMKFINTLKSRSNYDYGVDIDTSDSILTLSSCTPGGAGRVVLHAKKMNSSD